MERGRVRGHEHRPNQGQSHNEKYTLDVPSTAT